MPQNHLDYRTRDRPMHNAERVPEIQWQGARIVEGTTIAYDVTVFGPREKQSKVRCEGVVVELWLEHWWGSPHPLPYAEVDGHDGTEERVWFQRDRVSTELGFALGPAIEGGLF